MCAWKQASERGTGMSQPSPDTVALIAAQLLAADRVTEAVYAMQRGPVRSRDMTHEEAIEEAQRLALLAHGIKVPVL